MANKKTKLTKELADKVIEEKISLLELIGITDPEQVEHFLAETRKEYEDYCLCRELSAQGKSYSQIAEISGVDGASVALANINDNAWVFFLLEGDLAISVLGFKDKSRFSDDQLLFVQVR